MNRYLIADFDGCLLCGLRDEKRQLTFDLYRKDEILQNLSETDKNHVVKQAVQGDIYVAKVKKILRGQRAAFCDIAPGETCFLPLDRGSVLYADGSRSEKDCSDLKEGRDVIVQITKDAHANKKPVLSGYFTLPEFDDPRAKIREIIETARTRTCYSRIYRAPSALVRDLLSLNAEELEMIRTDNPAVYDVLNKDPFLKDAGLNEKLSLYTDDYPMEKLYSLRSGLDAALSRRVQMSGGTELVIEHTEAFWTVDVNSAKNGRAAGDLTKEETVLQTNLEAAEELAVQLCLRNMSGIIVVDFINMAEPESRDRVGEALKHACETDAAGVHLGGFTAFGLFELSRKRIRPALYEQTLQLGIKTRKNP